MHPHTCYVNRSFFNAKILDYCLDLRITYLTDHIAFRADIQYDHISSQTHEFVTRVVSSLSHMRVIFSLMNGTTLTICLVCRSAASASHTSGH